MHILHKNAYFAGDPPEWRFHEGVGGTEERVMPHPAGCNFVLHEAGATVRSFTTSSYQVCRFVCVRACEVNITVTFFNIRAKSLQTSVHE